MAGMSSLSAAIRDELESRLSLEAELERAVERKEFEMFYQPQVNLETADWSARRRSFAGGTPTAD